MIVIELKNSAAVPPGQANWRLPRSAERSGAGKKTAGQALEFPEKAKKEGTVQACQVLRRTLTGRQCPPHG